MAQVPQSGQSDEILYKLCILNLNHSSLQPDLSISGLTIG